MRRAALIAAGVAGALIACACGGGQTSRGVFSTSWDDDGGKSIEAVRVKLAGHPIPAGVDVAVGVAEHSSKMIGQPLAGGARWVFAHTLDARPVVAGGVVVASGGGDVFALDALTGKLLWTRPTGGLPLRGAGDDGSTTVVTLGSATGSVRGSTLLAVARDGTMLRQIERPVELGTPAVVGGLAFVPWDHEYVSVLDVADGSEIGRVVLREKTSHAWTVGGGLYFGELGLFRFDDKIKDASRNGADHLATPVTALPGHPVFLRPGEELVRPVATAQDKIRIYLRPTAPGTRLAVDSDRLYGTYFRLVLGLSGDGTSIAWVHTHGPEIVGGAAATGGVVLCDVDGKVTTLDAQRGGTVGDPLDLGEPLEGCVLQVDAFHKTGFVADPGSLATQIRIALSDRDRELDAGQTLLIRQLATLPDEAATELLLQLAASGGGAGKAGTMAPIVVDEVRTALAGRRTGARALVTSLEKHYDFLHDTVTPPPVGPIARALAAMNEKSAAPALASHLEDPADSDRDVRDVAQALVVLATPAEAPALLRFFALYHDAPADPEELPEAVNAVAEALLRVGGAEGKTALIAALGRKTTNPTVRAKVGALIDASGAIRGAAQSPAPSTTPSSTSRE